MDKGELDFGFPEAGIWNTTKNIPLENLKMDAHMVWLLCSLLSCISWVAYITFYNSRVIGLLITKIANDWFIKGAYFKLGSVTFNPLAGKIMFRDFIYVSFDHSVRIQDGYVIFRWWRSYVPKDVSEDLSHSDTRLSVQLNGFEVHFYNRSQLYNTLEKMFDLPSTFFLSNINLSPEEKEKMKEHAMNIENAKHSGIQKKKRPEAMAATTWRDLIPVIKIDICSGRFVFGNRLTPTTLSISMEEAHCTYSTKPAVCKLDHFMHFVKAKIENSKVMFAPSPKYTGLVDEPPRYMGEGFVVMMSNFMELYFYMDEPGCVPDEPVHLILANGDIVEPAPPVWGIDIKCGKGTDFSYGPWADRQRDHLFNFFFPSDWQKLIIDSSPRPGELRKYQSFDISLCTINEATIDILFSKEKETNAMHVTVGPGSYIEVTLPWITHPNGYVTKISGQLLHVEATTSLQYRSLAECESLEYKIRVHYPTKWNDRQDWSINLTGCKATAFIVYKHKSFFQDLIEDWSSKSRPDILTFVPYVCKFTILFKDFEILTLSNEYNWIDCSSTNQENHHLAFCGDLFDLSFALPFDSFLPQKVTLKFWIHGEGLDLSMYVPEVSSSRTIVKALNENSKILTRNGKTKKCVNMCSRKWRRICQNSSGWIDCWSVPIVALSIQYIYHPMPPLGPDPQADITTPEKEEILLSPMRIPKLRKSPVVNWGITDTSKFDPSLLPPDQVTVELEIGSSVLHAYGNILRNFIHLKENIFGEDQNFTDMEQSNVKLKKNNTNSNQRDIFLTKDVQTKSVSEVSIQDEKQNPFDSRVYRPLDVIVSVTIHDIQAHLLKNCADIDPPCPVIIIERLGFEMKKGFSETELQVLVSPSYLVASDNLVRTSHEKHIKQGHLLLSAVQVRGHAMFSGEGCKLGEDTLEYAWLLEIQIGKLSGKLSMAQLCDILISLETFVFLTLDPENCLKTPKTIKTCHHGSAQCSHSNEASKYICPSTDDIKYKMTRISIDAIDLYLIESGTALHTWISPVRLSTCNLHGQRVKAGISGLLPSILLRSFVLNNSSNFGTYRSGTKASAKFRKKVEQKDDLEKKGKNRSLSWSKTGKPTESIPSTLRDIEILENWLEVGCVSLGPILLECASALPIPEHKLHIVQHNFLKNHDLKYKKLWFIWTNSSGNQNDAIRCGCIGGCAFFGGNRNGLKFFKPCPQDAQDNYNIAHYHILNKPKEFGFGESILHDGKLVFHTPPYSLQPVSLQDNMEIFGKFENIKKSYEKKYVATKIEPTDNLKQEIKHDVKGMENCFLNSDPESKRFSNNKSKQSVIEVPYARLLDSPSKKIIKHGSLDSHDTATRRGSDPKQKILLKVSTPKNYVSDSRLTGEVYLEDDVEIPSKMSHSAPHSHQLEIDGWTKPTDYLKEFDRSNKNDVHRTVSLTSENPSELFFSAEEDIPITMSQTKIPKAYSTGSPKKKIISDFRSDQNMFVTENVNVSEYSLKGMEPHDSSSGTPSLSSTSFISAMSSQEDLSSFNLRMQVNRPIVESPLIMTSYLYHLPQLKCKNWNKCSFPSGADAFSIPLFQANESGGLTYIGNKLVPQFNCYHNWKEFKLLPRYEKTCGSTSSPNIITGTKCHPWDPSVVLKEEDCEKSVNGFEYEEFMSLETAAVSSCTSIVTRLKGQVNIFFTPLMLESVQRLIESISPTLSNMHILSVVNFMHSFCVNKVKYDNILKRDENLSYWSQVHSNSKRSTTERNLQAPGDSVLSDVYEESISTKTQGIIIMPKVSVILLQSSIVDEVCSVTASDNLQDFSCVSLLAFYFEGISMKFHIGKTTKASIHNIYIQQTVRSGNTNKKSGIMKGTKALLAHLSSQSRPDNVPGEPILIETSEKQLEELVLTLDIGRAHAQLRRLKNDGAELQNSQIMVTAIPEHKSKTMFECLRIPEINGAEDIGFIMFECGLEGVGTKIVKRSHFEKSDNSNDDVKDFKTMDIQAHTSNVNSIMELQKSKTEFSWKPKKPLTPKTPKEKFAHALEHIIITGDKDTRKTSKQEYENTGTIKDKKGMLEKVLPKLKETDKTSSCVIELKSVWFNFAAPPCVPITQKINLTRLDWNLLSTASPAITAWMNPSNRLAIKIIAALRLFHSRHTSVAACLMADALENEKFQRKTHAKKSRYSGYYTLLSKTLQEDPSCQLCTIMQKLVLEEGVDKIESIFKQGEIPHLNILRQGVIVLSRQWKNSLYNPILFEHQYKNKLTRPINLTFSFSQNEEECDDGEFDLDADTSILSVPVDNSEENENALLLGTIQNKHNYDTNDLIGVQIPISSLLYNENPQKSISKDQNYAPSISPRSSIQIMPKITGLTERHNSEIEYGALPDGSLSSNTSINKWNTHDHKDDLYFWMAKQQENIEKKHKLFRGTAKKTSTVFPNKRVLQDSIKLLDAHLIFEPLLTCLGVMPQQMINKFSNTDISSLENFGTNLSLIGTFDSIRVDIVESETGEKKKNNKWYKKDTLKNIIPIDAAFLCERVGIELELLKMSDGLADHAKQNVIFMSRRQLKKHTSTVINFSLNVRFISQQVNMPLLRLLHQITNMYQNVKDAQVEFQEQPEVRKKHSTAKDESSLASETNDITQFGSLSDRLTHNENSSDEKYDKFNCGIMLGQHLNKNRSSILGSSGQLNTVTHTKMRPQSFAQKLRSTGKSVKGKLGYTNLNDSKISPLRESPITLPCEVFNDDLKIATNQSLSMLAGYGNSTFETAYCWKTIYHLLELYGTMPETKMIQNSSFRTDLNEPSKQQKKSNDQPKSKTDEEFSSAPKLISQQSVSPTEKTRLVIFGVAKIHKTRLLASLSGLKLEAEITTFNSSLTWRKKIRPISLERSLTGQVGRAMIVLLEGLPPKQQTVVKMTIGKSQTLYSSINKKGKDKNSGLLSIGPVSIDIPQHPLALHGMMTRSSKQLSSTLQELRVGRTTTRNRNSEEPDSPFHPKDIKDKWQKTNQQYSKHVQDKNLLLQPVVMQFNILLQSLSVNAALLPSLQAQYKMNHVSSTGVTGIKAKFIIDLPTHTLSFATKIQTVEANLPSEACISLPPVHVSAEYISESRNEDTELDGIVLRKGGYVDASAEIGEFERCLTTDLLNHLVFVQKVFMKEVNEVIQKVYGGEKPVPLWSEDEFIQDSSFKKILFSLNICMKRIQLTATTPCSSAVRFETEVLELHLSNRVKNVGEIHEPKLFGKAHIDFNLALGQIIKNVIFDEAEPEFQQFAFFHTTVRLRNAFQEELVNEDKELILLTLKRPLFYVQPVAVDKAILVWLNYKNAYEYWAEKRTNLTKEVTGQQAIFEKAPFGQLGNIAASNLSMLFLQLTVEDMGICLPLNPGATTWGSRSYQDFEPKGAVVITLENTIISACNSGSLVSSGKFSGLCFRFADDFETTLDDWKPNMTENNIMNLGVVSEGTYEVCSRTIAAKNKENAKWFLNVKWQMEGVDIHLDVNIGKQLSSLGHTLTMLTGYEEDDDHTVDSGDSDEGDVTTKSNQLKKKDFDCLPEFVFDPSIDSKKRSILMENEMSEQLKIINDLRTLGASHNTIAHEERRLQELQALCYKYFRRDMIQKWKRPSIRSSILKQTNRSQSFAIPSYEKEVIEDKKLDTINSNDESFSLQSTPQSVYSLTNSLKTSEPNSQRAILSEAMRQQSLPNTEFDSDLTENEIEWASYDDVVQNEIEIDGSTVELRKKNNAQIQKQQEPNIDFELDIKVLVNSGKCVLHTKEILHDRFNSTALNLHQHKRERSIGNEWDSPTLSRKQRDKSKPRYSTNSALCSDITAFHIPGLDVKLHYQSKTIAEEANTKTIYLEASRRLSNKRASLFAWMTLQSIPEETIISPHILEFLEQTLEPIPTKNESFLPSSIPVNLELLPDNYVVYASFPVDVIVYFHMQPSTFRFSCLPVSRVECMLQLPSLDIVFSSKRLEDDENLDFEKNPAGGLSITGCLADFNVYIFHPYGGKKTGIKEAQFSPLTDSERKNSLSINVEFVKFHIARCRKLYIESVKSKRSITDSQSRAVIRFSTIVDIGSASFKYDMRRLTEILAFPKAWYRRRIVRRLFLGDLSFQKNGQNEFKYNEKTIENKGVVLNEFCERNSYSSEKPNLKIVNVDKEKKNDKMSTMNSNINQSEKNQKTAWETLVLFSINFTKLNVQMNMGNVMGNVIWLTKDFQSDGRLNIRSTGYKNMYIGVHLGGSSLDAKGGIVGGNFELNQIDTQFRIKEESGIEPHHTLGLSLKALELRLDYMGTSILMTRISDFSTIMKDEWKTTESLGHKIGIIFIHGDVSWDQLQIMISKSTTADVLKMYYKLEEFFTQQFKSSKRVFSNLDPRFNQRNLSVKRKQLTKKKSLVGMQITNETTFNTDSKHHRHWQKPLERATGFSKSKPTTNYIQNNNILGGTVLLHGNNISLACFHGINFKSKSWALFSLREPWINFATEAQYLLNTTDLQAVQTLSCSLGQSSKTPQNHSMAIVSRITRNVIFPPQFKNLNEWFQYAFANSDIDAIERFPVLEKDKEILSNSIERSRVSGASVSKNQVHNHNREIIFALPSLQFNFKTEHKQGPSTPLVTGEKPTVMCSFITEFDDHIFVTVDADAFFFLHDLISSYIKEKEKVMDAQITRAASPNSSHTNNITTKINSATAPNVLNNGHNIPNQPNSSDEQNVPKNVDQNNDLDAEADAFIRDWRRFECITWHLEPTVRLLSWAGKSIEPYGIDYILNKLGFSHARTTIPKWVQRGFMDPFDKMQAILMIQLLNLFKETKTDEQSNKTDKWEEEKKDIAKGGGRNYISIPACRRKSVLTPILLKIKHGTDGLDMGAGDKMHTKKVKRHSIHGMMEEDNVIRPHQEIRQLSLDEKKYLLAVERGDVAGTRRMMKKTQETEYINVNCVDPLGRTALLMAIDNENLEMVELLINYNVDTRDALLHAISEEFVEAVEVLLDYEDLQNDETRSWESLSEDTSTFTPDITPLILAAHRDNYEIIKILLDRGSVLPMPHDVRCGCDECVLSRQDDSLRHSRSRINAYRALASPSLIALSSKDPILTAFELSWELRRLSFLEHEFKNEYQELRKQCQDFATALLDHTRTSCELEILLNHDPSEPLYEHGERMHLNRLKLAIKLRQKKFVAHPNVQQLLASIWYEGLPGFRRKNMALQAVDIIRIGILFPIFSFAYIFAPNSALGRTMRKPFIKFICHSASYFTFLFLLILASQRIESFVGEWYWQDKSNVIQDEMPTKRGAKPSFIEWIILAWVSGLIWSEVKQLWDVGLQEYLNDMWNVIDFVTNSLYVATVALRVVSFIQVRAEMELSKFAADLPREKWDNWDPMLISEGLFSAANIFSALKLVYIFSVNPHLGPLQVSLSRMVMDIIKFFFLYVLVLFAFSSGLNQLLWYYADLEKKRCPEITLSSSYILNGTADPNACIVWRRFSNLFETTQTLFWAVFGLIDLDSFELDGIKIFTRFWGMLMFGTYSVINIVVLLNLLIAMMNHSYQLISERADTEWKFARSKLWISYFEEGATCPPPFNIIPTPKTSWYMIQWIKKKFCKNSSAARREHLKTIRKKNQQANDRDFKYQQIMRNLVRRYVTVEQRNAESQGVTEDDVNEIKQDISAFRCELVEILKNSGMDTNVSANQGAGASGKKNRQKERRLMKGFNIALPGSTGSLAPVTELMSPAENYEEEETSPLGQNTLHTQTFNKAVLKYNKKTVSSKRKWGTLIEAAKVGRMTKMLSRSRSADSVCKSSEYLRQTLANDGNGKISQHNILDITNFSKGKYAATTLKRKRKKFSLSKNATPFKNNTSNYGNYKTDHVLRRVSSYPVQSMIPDEGSLLANRHDYTQSQYDSADTCSAFVLSNDMPRESSNNSVNSRDPLLHQSSTTKSQWLENK